ncbi:DUF3298 and DUF4163 domain-containing protein [Ascidiimonas aurantiaca]|uniref:DUF3298 and DUF4163 domain-containing protein n=1 Tax=Ascidiimonas aurantiaca TaxID=1685432 RepID=UPI0030ECEEBC
MKKYVILIGICTLLFSCQEESTISFVNKEVSSEKCENCAEVQISYPEAAAGSDVATAINTAIEEHIIFLLNYTEENTPDSVERAISDFTYSYEVLRSEFPETPAWEADIEGRILYRDDFIICIQVDSYLFTGGAHGYGATAFMNFDPETGILLQPDDIFSDLRGFTELAEKKFRQQENIPDGANINSTGLMFEDDVFVLPENIGFTSESILLVYNQYEIASYADGQKKVEIPLNKVRSFMKRE